MGRALAIWTFMMSVETMHGVVRALLLAPAAGDVRARLRDSPLTCEIFPSHTLTIS